MKKLLFIAASVFMISNTAQAGFVFSPTVGYFANSFDIQSASGDVNETQIDLKFGYVFPMGFYVGALYGMYSATSGTAEKRNGSWVGPTIGYYHPMGFHAMLTYHIMADMDDPRFGVDFTNVDGELGGGSGLQVDIGWVFPLASSFAIGPQLTYRALDYTKRTPTGGVEADVDYKWTAIRPMINLWFMF